MAHPRLRLLRSPPGRGSKPLTVEQQVSLRGLPKDIVTPSSYVFDVYRVDGGQRHEYRFHGPISDEVETNVTMARVPAPTTGGEPSNDASYLAAFRKSTDNGVTWSEAASLALGTSTLGADTTSPTAGAGGNSYVAGNLLRASMVRTP